MTGAIVVVLATLGGVFLASNKTGAEGFFVSVAKAIWNVVVVLFTRIDLMTFIGIACIIGAYVVYRANSWRNTKMP